VAVVVAAEVVLVAVSAVVVILVAAAPVGVGKEVSRKGAKMQIGSLCFASLREEFC
jgi:hypothetical protein